tara:strand:- start:7661 stop:8110 length:450 start_codon:yes stop_codon:yes gene_type:complete
MKIVFLHGLESQTGGKKPQQLERAGHEVFEPELPRNDFQGSLEIAQSYVDEHVPDVIVGSSRGGAVAMNVDPKGARLVLVSPAWNIYGTNARIASNSTVIHSKEDNTIPYSDSMTLSALNKAKLVQAGSDHRMNDQEALAAILDAVERW